MEGKITDNLWLLSFLEKDTIFFKREVNEIRINDDIQCLIVTDENNIDLQNLAQNIASACGFNVANTFITNDILPLANFSKMYPNLTTVLLFDAKPEILNENLNIPTFSHTKLQQINIINCATLQQLNADKGLKNQLWNQVLKPLYKK